MADMVSMMRSMWDMMKLMDGNQSGIGSGSGMEGIPGNPSSWSAWPGMAGMAGMPGASGWPAIPGGMGMPGAGLSQGTIPWRQLMPGQWGGGSGSPQARGLDGFWRGSDGSLMLFRGNRFLVMGSGGQQGGGSFMISDNRFIAYSNRTDSTQQFRMEMRDGMLALQDERGQITIFKRLRR